MTYIQPFKSHLSAPLKGYFKVPGDKSISHRALMLSSIAAGESMITGLLESEDVMCTAAALKELGAQIHNDSSGIWRVKGRGNKSFLEPIDIINLGNSGTSARLLMGLLAGHNIAVTLTGDTSLNNRPMGRVITPLSTMGTRFLTRSKNRLPLTMIGTESLSTIQYTTPVASAQIKSCLILAALNAKGSSTIIEKTITRDHTEKMLDHFGVKVGSHIKSDGSHEVNIESPQLLKGCSVDVPSDPSSAAFPTVAALLIKDSHLKLEKVCVNTCRTGLYETLIEMGANIKFVNERLSGGEKVADIEVTYNGALTGVTVPEHRVPSMIDEFPILAIAASCANGKTTMNGLSELRVKESDRLKLIAEGLKLCGVDLTEGDDSLVINGNGRPPQGGASIETGLDHRIAMSFLILGCTTKNPITIDDASPINTSFPRFIDKMNELGTNIEPTDLDLKQQLSI
jgi:3-phosphoshikimate 1-carboxyvinyltransferase